MSIEEHLVNHVRISERGIDGLERVITHPPSQLSERNVPIQIPRIIRSDDAVTELVIEAPPEDKNLEGEGEETRFAYG